ncbi:Glutamate--tRNA ligase mitochondrial [Lecanora helva]
MGPINRTILYQTYATKLLESGDAYRCFCSTERLNNLAKERNRLGLPSDYDRACANVSKEESDDRSSRKEPYVIRLKVPDVLPHFTDLVYGVVGKRRIIKRLPSQRAQPSYEDPVLLKSDGLPTYHLANVVDDHFMEITHVIRAAEWMSSTPKHMVMYDAFKWQPPTFAHVGLLQDSSRQKFSKRDSSLDIYSFKEDGIFPEALVNYVALFGWSHRQGNDFLNLQDLVENFDLKFTKGNTIVTPNKLVHLQKRYAQKYVSESQEYFASMVVRVLEVAQKHLENHPKSRFCTNDELREKVAALLRVDAANYSTPREFFERNQHFLCVEPRPECVVREGDLVTGSGLEYIGSELSKVSNDQWNEERLKQSFDLAVKKMEEGRTDDFSSGYRKSLQHFLRWALTGGRPGPSIIASLSILGRDESLSRIKDADAILEDLGI